MRVGQGRAGGSVSSPADQASLDATASTEPAGGAGTPAPNAIASARRAPRLGWWPRLVLAVLAGAVTGLAFPPFDLAWLAPLGAGALTALCRGVSVQRAFWLGLGYGLAYFLLLFTWLLVPGPDAWAVVSLIQALYLGLLGVTLALVTRLRGWPVWAAALWVAAELLRSNVPLGGLPWGRLASALVDTPFASYAALGGPTLVAFLAALAGNLVVWAVVAGRGAIQRGGVLAAAVVLVVAGLGIPRPVDGEREATAAIVQGNIPGEGLDFLGRARTVTRNHLEATRQLMADVRAGKVDKPSFVLWPENSTDLSPFNDAPTRRMVEEAADLVDVPLVIGTMLDGPDPQTQVENTLVVWDEDAGPGRRYVKQKPVPFGEYIPFRSFFTQFIDRLEKVPRDMVPGDRPGDLELAGTKVGALICFEVAYDDVVEELMRRDVDLLAVQTNNGTFMGTGQSEQQFAMTRLRAIETGRSALVASTSGISGVVEPDGSVRRKSEEMTRQVYVESVPVREQKTLASVLGRWPGWIIAAGGVLALAFAAHSARRRREAA